MVSPSVVPQIGVLLCLRVVENPGRCAVAGLETQNGRVPASRKDWPPLRVACARIQEAKLSLLGKMSMLESSSRRATSRWSGNSRLPAMFLRRASAVSSPPPDSSSRQSMVGGHGVFLLVGAIGHV